MTKLLYVAEPIDFAEAMGRNQIEILLGCLVNRDWATYRPYRAWQIGSKTAPGPGVDRVNREALANSHALVAYLPERAVSIGVPREIELAVSYGIPTAVIRPTLTKVPWALQDVRLFGEATDVAKWLDTLKPNRYERQIVFQVGPAGTAPTRSYDGDAGFDLYASHDLDIGIGEFGEVHTDVRMAMPDGVWARITGRSSTWRKYRLMCIEGVIDTGYRGELIIGVWNAGQQDVSVSMGDRLAQVIPHFNLNGAFQIGSVGAEEFARIPAVDNRGGNGFGSSGR